MTPATPKRVQSRGSRVLDWEQPFPGSGFDLGLSPWPLFFLVSTTTGPWSMATGRKCGNQGEFSPGHAAGVFLFLFLVIHYGTMAGSAAATAQDVAQAIAIGSSQGAEVSWVSRGLRWV